MITKNYFGKTKNNEDVNIFTLKSQNLEVSILDLGGTVVSIKTKDKNNETVDVCLGYQSIDGYNKYLADGYLGAVIGRVGNRINKGKFTLNGKEYNIFCNNDGNSLHGGKYGFDSKVWDSKTEDNKLILRYLSVDNEENYPGNLKVEVVYTIKNENSLQIEYSATSDKDTIVNLTNHTYFNLNGGKNTVYDQILQMNCSSFTPVDKTLIPTGEIRSVENTPFDFRVAKEIGKDIEENYEQLIFGNGYDHNFCIDGSGFRKAVELYNKENGICMECYTDNYGVQVYTGNFLEGRLGKNNNKYFKRYAVCFETQNYPDAINHENFPTPILKAGEKYHTITEYKFFVK